MYPPFCFQCPVFDLVRNVEFSGEYQTVTKKGAITVTVRKFFCFQYGGEACTIPCTCIYLRNRALLYKLLPDFEGDI